MPHTDPPEPGPSLFQEHEVIEYKAVSGLAVVGLLMGFASGGAALWPLLWIVPPLGIVLNAVALRRIARYPSVLTGRKLAVTGLCLSLFFLAMVPSDWLAYRLAMRRQAESIALLYFEALRNDEPIKAFQLTLDPRERRPLDRLTREIQLPESTARSAYESFVNQPVVRCLLALGERAEVRHYVTEGQLSTAKHEVIADVYAVTYEEDGQRKTFFSQLSLKRFRSHLDNKTDWQVALNRGGYRPITIGGKKAS